MGGGKIEVDSKHEAIKYQRGKCALQHMLRVSIILEVVNIIGFFSNLTGKKA